MADRKNDQERDELFRRIYKIATDLVHAGHVAEWDFKSYVPVSYTHLTLPTKLEV